jgi:hypothetical protein
LQFGELPAFPSVITQFVVREGSAWNNLSSDH